MGREPADPIVAYDDNNRPVFGYNDRDVPVCFSKLAGRNHLRCMSPVRCANGRCKKHGGMNPRGPAHQSYRSGKWSSYMTETKAQDLLDAVQDPEYLSLRDDMAMNSLEMLELTKGFKQGTDGKTWEKIDKLATELEVIIFSEECGNFLKAMGGTGSNLTRLGNIAEELVKLIKSGRDEKRLFKEIGETQERRRRLVETETKRMMMEKNHMPADQALHLFQQFVNVVTKIWAHDHTNLRAFAGELDNLSAIMPSNNVMLQGTPGAMGMIAPKSALADTVRNRADSTVINVDGDDD